MSSSVEQKQVSGVCTVFVDFAATKPKSRTVRVSRGAFAPENYEKVLAV